MKVVLNGEPSEVALDNVQSMIDARFPGIPVAVAINGEFIPRSRFSETTFQEGDQIEVLSPKQGG